MATKDRTALKDEFKNGNLATGERFADLIDSMKVVQLPVVDPQALGTSLSFIDSISQDADGKITATKKTLDLANAHELNPFKGWYKTGDILPTDGFDGAYLYFKDTSELTGQTTIYRWNGTTYADTGTVVDESNVQTFGSGQQVNSVKIKDENGVEVTGAVDVLSAEAGKNVADKVQLLNTTINGVDDTPINVDLSELEQGNGQPIIYQGNPIWGSIGTVRHVVIPLDDYSSFIIVAKSDVNTLFALLTSYDTSVAPQFASGETGIRSVNNGATYTLSSIPSDVHYLCIVVVGQGGVDTSPQSVTVTPKEVAGVLDNIENLNERVETLENNTGDETESTYRKSGIVDLSTLPQTNGRASASSWTNLTTVKHVVIDVYKTTVITITGNATNRSQFVFLKSYNPEECDGSHIPDYATNSQLTQIGQGLTKKFAQAWMPEYGNYTDIPSDARYLYIEMSHSNGVNSPSEVYVKYDTIWEGKPCDYPNDDVSLFTKCLCIGDSVTEGTYNYNTPTPADAFTGPKHAYPTYFQKITNIQTDNKGVAGLTTKGWWEWQMDSSHSSSYKYISDWSGYDMAIICLGINDSGTAYGGWNSDSESAMTSIINKLKTENSGIKIFVCTIPPLSNYRGQSIEATNTAIRTLVNGMNDQDVILIDLAQHGHTYDSMAYNCGHPSAYGYLRLAMDLKAYIGYYMLMNKMEFRTVQFIGTEYGY